jgi:hypothetical protein
MKAVEQGCSPQPAQNSSPTRPHPTHPPHYPGSLQVQPGERNAYDQQWLQQTLWERHRVRTARMTLAQIAAGCAVDAATGELIITAAAGAAGGRQRVGLVYFR